MMLDSISWTGAMKVGKAIEFASNAGLGDGWDECEQRPTADMDSSQHRSTAEQRPAGLHLVGGSSFRIKVCALFYILVISD